jgi:hypothetical protein
MKRRPQTFVPLILFAGWNEVDAFASQALTPTAIACFQLKRVWFG